MTVDQRLIVRLEEVSKAVDQDQLLAAFHLLDQILKEVGPHRNPREAKAMSLERAPKATPPGRAAAAG